MLIWDRLRGKQWSKIQKIGQCKHTSIRRRGDVIMLMWDRLRGKQWSHRH